MFRRCRVTLKEMWMRSSSVAAVEPGNWKRELSTQAAETASKQHLESIKKVAKLEVECRRLKAPLHIQNSQDKGYSSQSMLAQKF